MCALCWDGGHRTAPGRSRDAESPWVPGELGPCGQGAGAQECHTAGAQPPAQSLVLANPSRWHSPPAEGPLGTASLRSALWVLWATISLFPTEPGINSCHWAVWVETASVLSVGHPGPPEDRGPAHEPGQQALCLACRPCAWPTAYHAASHVSLSPPGGCSPRAPSST